ncbi:MAG: hypothetical protein DI551_10485 [Micavibrio aeruginosavorus]|uniref:Thioredoxin-like fold domain-containing protein n=1 Tax=Micavibrio aeruginosavorus TaxID=349221 RepID=A0A2W5MTZ3_9BACT|nr:MAG: hypothetical protein DI551_10485 [Micavibrio aeruginosavorus]
MNSKNTNVSGNGLLVGLLLIALVGAAILGWFYINKQKPMDALPESSEIATEQTPPVSTDAEGGAVPTITPPNLPAADADAPVVNPSSTSEVIDSAPVAESVKIDVATAFAPRTIGNADAPIKIIEYASLTCSHCAHFHNDILPELKSKYVDTGKVQIEFREFPLNDPALKASLTARCLPADKYESFVNLLFKTQEHWAGGLDYMAALKQNAKLAGMSDATFEACQKNPELKLKLAEGMQVAQDKWKLNSTPTFIINDGAEIISGAQPLTEFERIFRKVSGDAIGQAPAVE